MSDSSPAAIRNAGLLARRPAIPAAISLMLGIFAHRLLPHWPIVWTSLLAVALLGGILFYRRGIICSVSLVAAFGLAGLALAQVEAFYYPSSHIIDFAADRPQLARLELHLDYAPRVLTWPFGQYRALPPKQVATASVRRIKTWAGWTDCHGQVLVQIAQPNPRLRQGQVLRVIGKLERPAPAMNPGQFDWAGYYREQRILASVQISEAENVQIIDAAEPAPLSSPLEWLREQTRRTLARGFRSSDQLDHALLRALLLGDNDPELRDVQEQFRRTGTSHHLAISGMHVAVLGGVVFGLCRLLRVSPRAACWLALLFVILYGIVALPSPPVVRSVILCAAFAVGILNRRATDPLQLLAISVIGMLIYHPLDLYNAGFQLSFGTVLGLMLFTRPLLDVLPGYDEDEQIALSMQRPGRLWLTWIKIKHWSRTTLAAAIVAWVVSMPLVAYHFEQLNPWAIVASIILAPIVFISLIGGFAKVVLTLLWPSAASAWAAGAVRPVAWMRATVDWLATFPGADVPLPAPPLWMLIAYYILLLLMLIPWRRPILKWTARSAVFGCCLVLAVMPLRKSMASVQQHSGDLQVTLLAVGAGQCAVVQPPDAEAIVIDAGSATLSDVLHKAFGPFLRHQGRRTIRSIYISHANYDHFSAVSEIATAYDVREIFVSPQFRRQCIDNPPAEGLLRTLDELDRPPRSISAGQSIDIGGGATLEVVWPPEQTPLDINNCSLVLRLRFAGRSILLTGDVQSAAQRELAAHQQLCRADVLVAPHHGSFEPATAGFIDAVAPSIIVCSNDRTPSVKQREFDRVLAGRTVYRTNSSGSLTVRITTRGEMSVEPFLAAP